MAPRFLDVHFKPGSSSLCLLYQNIAVRLSKKEKQLNNQLEPGASGFQTAKDSWLFVPMPRGELPRARASGLPFFLALKRFPACQQAGFWGVPIKAKRSSPIRIKRSPLPGTRKIPFGYSHVAPSQKFLARCP
jgi:hypothetical protein